MISLLRNDTTTQASAAPASTEVKALAPVGPGPAPQAQKVPFLQPSEKGGAKVAAVAAGLGALVIWWWLYLRKK